MYQAGDEELDRLEFLRIIAPIEFLEWTAPIVILWKSNDSIGICDDCYNTLQDPLETHHY